MKTIAEIYSELEEAQKDFDAKTQEESFASGRTTAALNRLNTAQKALDAFVGDLKQAASYRTEWKRSKGVAIE